MGGEEEGQGEQLQGSYCNGMPLCLFLDFEGTLSGLNDHSLILLSFLGSAWVFSNSEKPFLSVDSGEESRDLS